MASVGYRRISIVDQDTGKQLEDVVLDKVFEEKINCFIEKLQKKTFCNTINSR